MNQEQQEYIFDDWLGRHRGILSKVARSFAADGHDRDDLLQEIGLQVWRSIPSYREEVSVTTWMYRVAFYTAISWSRKEQTRKRPSHTLQGEPPAREPPTDPRVDWLYAKIAELEPIDRSLALLLLDGFSYRDMSATLGISESNVGVRINRIKKRLTDQLQRENYCEL